MKKDNACRRKNQEKDCSIRRSLMTVVATILFPFWSDIVFSAVIGSVMTMHAVLKRPRGNECFRTGFLRRHRTS
ncbi:MAG TPA: hypothetical protein VEI57_17720 [Nitrospirota bacterium]|nr:hypothetical protein [Nitrospirota bacterium]